MSKIKVKMEITPLGFQQLSDGVLILKKPDGTLHMMWKANDIKSLRNIIRTALAASMYAENTKSLQVFSIEEPNENTEIGA